MLIKINLKYETEFKLVRYWEGSYGNHCCLENGGLNTNQECNNLM